MKPSQEEKKADVVFEPRGDGYSVVSTRVNSRLFVDSDLIVSMGYIDFLKASGFTVYIREAAPS